MKKSIVIETISLLFVLLFIYAGANKLMDVTAFRSQLGQSPLLASIAGLVAYAIPGLEFVLSLLLISGKWRLLSLYGCFGLMVGFSAYIIVITRFSYYVPCACGGVLEHLSWSQHLIFNLLFVALAVIAILIYPQKSLHASQGNAEHL